MNPLLFMPSPRDIPAVKKQWHNIPYDKFIVKYKPQLEAYTEGREFFINHPEYTHFVICPDDLEVTPEHIKSLLLDVRIGQFQVISGICNIDETQPDTYAIQPVGCDFSKSVPVHYGAWYMKTAPRGYEKTLPKQDIFQVGHSGFCCEVIERSVMEKVSWVGSTPDKRGNFDWQFSHDCHDLGIDIFVDQTVNIWHRRFEQSEQALKIRESQENNGYSYLIEGR